MPAHLTGCARNRRPGHPACLGADTSAVTPVIGTILILGITVTGIVGVMVWGAPLIQDLQDRNAQAGVVAEFLEVRDAARKLTGAQEARSVGFNLPGGEVHLREGSQFLVTVNHDSGNAACDLRVGDWDDGNYVVTFDGAAGCAMPADGCESSGGACVEGYSISGSSLSVNILQSYAGGVATFTDAIDTEQTWAFRVTDGSGLPIMDAWLYATDELAWDRQSGQSDREVVFAWGMVLSRTDVTVYAESQPGITEDARRAGDIFLRVPTIESQRQSISGTGSHAVFLALDALAEDIDVDDGNLIRYTFSGEWAESHCNTMVLRNQLFDGTPYADCAQEDTVWTTLYTPDSGPVHVEVTHAEILASLVL